MLTIPCNRNHKRYCILLTSTRNHHRLVFSTDLRNKIPIPDTPDTGTLDEEWRNEISAFNWKQVRCQRVYSRNICLHLVHLLILSSPACQHTPVAVFMVSYNSGGFKSDFQVSNLLPLLSVQSSNVSGLVFVGIYDLKFLANREHCAGYICMYVI